MSPDNAATPEVRILDPDYIAQLSDTYVEDLSRVLKHEFHLQRQDAEDVLANLFGELFAKHASGQPVHIGAHDNPRDFLYRMLKNDAIDKKRWFKAHPGAEASPDIVAQGVPSPLSQIVGQEQISEALKAFDALPEKERALLTLVDQEQVSLRDAARRVELPYKTAADLYARVHRKLQAALGRRWSTYIVPADDRTYKPRTRRGVLGHIDELPLDYRAALLAKYVEGSPDADIAVRLGVSREAFAARLKTAETHLEKKTGLSMAEIVTALGKP